jgi:hypothetical protein
MPSKSWPPIETLPLLRGPRLQKSSERSVDLIRPEHQLDEKVARSQPPMLVIHSFISHLKSTESSVDLPAPVRPHTPTFWPDSIATETPAPAMYIR